jgi:molybdopterin-containing oxidoreductase family iron-sulfur binding subunit
MVIDLTRCVGCNSCTVACKQANATPPGVLFTRVFIEERGTYPNTHLEFLPVICNHCNDAPCVDVCPTGATQKLADGRVTIDQSKCLGCRSCMVACAYNARYFAYSDPEPNFPEMGYTPYEEARYADNRVGTVMKCDFCPDRVAEEGEPACVAACPCEARIFGDLDDPNSAVSRLIAESDAKQLHPELGTDPSVYYLT